MFHVTLFKVKKMSELIIVSWEYIVYNCVYKRYRNNAVLTSDPKIDTIDDVSCAKTII